MGSKVGAKTSLCLPIAAARLVLLALAIVAEHVATVGLSSEGRTRGASCHGSGAALCRSSGSTPGVSISRLHEIGFVGFWIIMLKIAKSWLVSLSALGFLGS